MSGMMSDHLKVWLMDVTRGKKTDTIWLDKLVIVMKLSFLEGVHPNGTYMDDDGVNS